MKNKEIIDVKIERINSITCDVCNKTFTDEDDPFEYQEIISIRKRCGYSSRFGDENEISLDICDACFHLMFKNNVNYLEDEY